jgi:hypothetical protein
VYSTEFREIRNFVLDFIIVQSNLGSQFVDSPRIVEFLKDFEPPVVPVGEFNDAIVRLLPGPASWPRRRRAGRVMQQTLIRCAFCDAPPGTKTGEAHT